MVTREARTLSRDVEVAAIPYDDKLTLAAGTNVYITQALGGSYTAMTDHGYLVRIEGKDADAIGETPMAPVSELSDASLGITRASSWKVWAQSKRELTSCSTAALRCWRIATKVV